MEDVENDVDAMRAFAASHGIGAQAEHFPMSRFDAAIEHLRAGKARYRVLLNGDFKTACCAGQLTITKHPHGCLMVFPRPEWEKFRERIAALPMAAQWWKRVFLGNAMDVDMDSTGRVLVSPELRTAAGISRDTLLLGMGNHFELWDKATYDAKEAEATQGEMPDVFQDFSF